MHRKTWQGWCVDIPEPFHFFLRFPVKLFSRLLDRLVRRPWSLKPPCMCVISGQTNWLCVWYPALMIFPDTWLGWGVVCALWTVNWGSSDTGGGLTGTIPTQLGLLTALTFMCALKSSTKALGIVFTQCTQTILSFVMYKQLYNSGLS